MGPVSSILGMLPGLPGKQLKNVQVDDKQLDRVEAIIMSMTPQERRHPDIIDGSRRQRIARGSGAQVNEINQLLKQFRETQRLMKQFASGKPGRFGIPGLGR
jgi:signal recognition particle subunit SRP54